MLHYDFFLVLTGSVGGPESPTLKEEKKVGNILFCDGRRESKNRKALSLFDTQEERKEEENPFCTFQGTVVVLVV